MSVILTKSYDAPTVCRKEILRYAGSKTDGGSVDALLDECLEIVKNKLSYKVCYTELGVQIKGGICDFGFFSVESKGLATNLNGCKSVILFGATVGVELDRLIAKYGRISPAKALMIQSIGAERIEALCDLFCADIEKENKLCLNPRFSPGYGDLSVEVQKDIFNVLGCSKAIGLTLTDSLLMSPSKSVTAFAGISCDNDKKTVNKCSLCTKTDCVFRGIK